MSLQVIIEHLENGFTHLIIPESALQLPIEKPDMLKEDEEGNLTDEHYSLQGVSDAVGKLLSPTKIIDDKHVSVRWSFDEDGQQKTDFIAYMESKGLVNIRGLGVKVADMDFSNIPENGFMVCSLREMKYIPKPEITEPEV